MIATGFSQYIANLEWKKYFILFIIGFFVYMGIEVLFTGFGGKLVGYGGRKYWGLCGTSTPYMGILGGLLIIILGRFNEINWVKNNLNLLTQSILGALVITAFEFISGCILNLWLGFHIWDYSRMPLNVLGQINILFSIFWLLLYPFIAWLDDLLRWVFYRLGSCTECYGPYNLGWFYLQIFNLKPLKFKELKLFYINKRN